MRHENTDVPRYKFMRANRARYLSFDALVKTAKLSTAAASPAR